ncbi:MAG: CinA family protein [Candidatus Heimdallarchaeota archaeon]|nr:CinA family protein [Candidatus Heimdallarchaeota archaeon]
MVDLESVSRRVHEFFTGRDYTIAVAESCTGGLICHSLTNHSGSSKYFTQGVVTYSAEAKTNILKIPRQQITKYGVVSIQIALEMAKQVRILFNSNIGISSTGFTGPSGGTIEHSVGTAFVAVATDKWSKSVEIHSSSDREGNKSYFAARALELILEIDAE